MGNCASQNDNFKKQSLTIDQDLKSDFESTKGYKILLLGPGDAGKSTFLKQLTELYSDKKHTETPEMFTETIYGNTIASIKTLIKKSEELSQKLPECAMSSDTKSAAEQVNLLMGEDDRETSKISEENAAAIFTVWKDEGIQQTYLQRTSFQLLDCANYFLDKVITIGKPTYRPSKADIVRCRLRTIGISEVKFSIGDSNFTIVDVGGQRSERQKWIHCFEDCVSVLFFVSAAAYDQVLFEDENTNCMEEALALFEQVYNSRWFSNAECILFLNKCDIFKEKLERVPLSAHFPEYNGGEDYAKACDFLTNEFSARCRVPRKLLSHFTCMTDDSTIQSLFEEVMKILLRKNLEEGNLFS